jgi:hypothetical protein
MKDSTNENLKELLAGFMDADMAGQAAQDIEKGDRLLRDFPAPLPSDNVIAGIKLQMAAASRRQHRTTYQHRIWATVGVAAAIILASVASLKLFEQKPVEQTAAQYAVVIPDRVWDGSDIPSDISVLSAELDSLEKDITSTSVDEVGDNSNLSVGDLEMELIETGGNLWKG